MMIKALLRRQFMHAAWYRALSHIKRMLFQRMLCLRPIRPYRIYFSSLAGRSRYNDPGYVRRLLQSECPEGFECIVRARPAEADRIAAERRHAIRTQLSAACVVEDSFSLCSLSRPAQLVINTWHGGGFYKMVRPEAPFECDVFLSSSDVFTDLVRKQWGFTGTILPIGQPRNDILFDTEQHPRIRAEVKQRLGLSPDTDIVLYAPTWRDGSDLSIPLPDPTAVRAAYRRRFGRDCAVLFRGHYHLPMSPQAQTVNVNDWPDVQELLVAADLLISDYSSIIWDYSFLYRPCLLYTPDLERYLELRGLETDIHSWHFPVCMDHEQLCAAILAYDEAETRRAMEQHHTDLGACETGHATETVVALLREFCAKDHAGRMRMKRALRDGGYDISRLIRPH